MEIWLATAVVFGEAETVVCRLVKSLWLAFRASPLVRDEVVARGATAEEIAVFTADVVSKGTKAAVIALLTYVFVGKDETVVCRAVRSLLSAFRAKPLVRDELVARGATAVELAALIADDVSNGTKAAVIALLTDVFVGKVETVFCRLVKSL